MPAMFWRKLRIWVTCPEGERLTEPHRLVFELAVYQERPYQEISDLLKIPVQGVIQGQSLAPLALGETFQRAAPVMTSRIPQVATSPVPVATPAARPVSR